VIEQNVWMDEEVMKLIEIWGEDTILAQLEGCKHNKEVHKGIEGNEGSRLQKKI